MSDFLRKVATPLSFITFLGVGITGILMMFRFRGPLGEVHEWLGLAFIVALLLHLVRNGRGVLAMLKTPTSKTIVGVIGVVSAVAIFFALPSGSGYGHGYGHGQGFGHGGGGIVMHRVSQSPIASMAPALGLSSDTAIAKLRSGGVEVDSPQETLADISRDHGQPIPRLFALLLNE